MFPPPRRSARCAHCCDGILSNARVSSLLYVPEAYSGLRRRRNMARRAPKKAQPRAMEANAPAADAERVRERILVAFSAKAKRAGIRAVVMGELASELRMSPMTLYKHFPA